MEKKPPENLLSQTAYIGIIYKCCAVHENLQFLFSGIEKKKRENILLFTDLKIFLTQIALCMVFQLKKPMNCCSVWNWIFF